MDNMIKRLKRTIPSSEKLNERLAKCPLFNKFHHIAAVPPPPVPSGSKTEDDLVMISRPPPEVRLVLFKELTETSERMIIFDSKSFDKIELPVTTSMNCCENKVDPNACLQQKPQQYEYKFVRTSSDWNVLSEMLFGSVGMAQNAASLKIHYMKSPSSIMLSRVFCLPSKESGTASLDRGMENYFETQRANSISSRRKAKTIPVPFSPATTPTSSMTSSLSSQNSFLHRSDSGISLSSFFASSFQGTAVQGSFGGGRANSLPPNPRDSFTLSDEAPFERVHSALSRMRMKIGFAVICEPEPSNVVTFQEFFFRHFPLIESHMTNLKEKIEKSFQSSCHLRPKSNFFELMMKALADFSSKLRVLYSTPRLPEPVWATITPPLLKSEHRRLVVDSFIGDLARLVSEHNTKQKNYFLSGLLTAVLTHHLGWVASASPPHCRKQETDENAYNALWAQLGDLYGAVGAPTKVCRTVVTGNCHELVSTFLSVLSHFIRSSAVDEVVSVPEQLSPMSLGVLKPSVEAISLSSVPGETSDSEDFVLVSLMNDEKQPLSKTKEKQKDSSESISTPSEVVQLKTPLSKSSTSMNKSETGSPLNTLSRSYSGPVIKYGCRSRSNAILENKLTIRQRTFSKNALAKASGIQSRRNSNHTADVAMATSSNLRNSLTKNNRQTKGRHETHIDTKGSLYMKGIVDIDLPDVPSHEPGCDLSNRKDMTSSKSMPCFNNVDEKTTGRCVVIPSFVDKIHPKLEHAIHVQRSCPQLPTDEESIKLKSSFQAKSNTGLDRAPEQLPGIKSIIVDTCEEAAANSFRSKSPSRSLSNPSTASRDSFLRTHRRCFSNTSVKVKLGARRHQLPTFSDMPEVATNNVNNDDSSSKSESPSFQRIKLLRIPSVEINHNTFEEYFDKETGDISEITEVIETATTLTSSNHSALTHNVTSCPAFTGVKHTQRPNFLDLGKISTQTVKSDSAAPFLYPHVPTLVTSPPSVPRRRKNSRRTKVYPPLPSKPPVGVVSFKVGEESVSFHLEETQKRSTSTPHAEETHFVAGCAEKQCLLPSEATRPKQDNTNLICSSLTELPLTAVKKSSSVSNNRENEQDAAATGFASLMADYNQEYLNDFVLHGAPNHPDMHKKILQDLSHVIRNPALDEPIAEAVCIVADTDSWSVKVYSSQRLHSGRPALSAMSSKLVCSFLTRVACMYKMKMSPEFCLNHLESELRQLVLKSRMLAEYARGQKKITMGQLSAALSIESQDLPLLMAIASYHSPHVAPIMW